MHLQSYPGKVYQRAGMESLITVAHFEASFGKRGPSVKQDSQGRIATTTLVRSFVGSERR
jgi:hypothetical protein